MNSIIINKLNINKNHQIFDYEKVGKYSYLANGNCLDYLKMINDDEVDLILTDPPYNIANFMHRRNTNIGKMRENHFAYAGWDDLELDEWLKNMHQFFDYSGRILKKNGSLILFMSLIKVETVIKIAEKYGFYYKTVGIWHKTNPMPRNMNLQFVNSTEAWLYFINRGTTGTFNNNNKLKHDFFETSLTSSKEKKMGKHPTQKPVSIVTEFVNLLSNENDVVLDPFMGSGTTAVACEKTKRNFMGIELNKEYYSIAVKRIKEVL